MRIPSRDGWTDEISYPDLGSNLLQLQYSLMVKKKVIFFFENPPNPPNPPVTFPYFNRRVIFPFTCVRNVFF